jgi:ubiquinone/menaquinone biosynthesis C-methylase UbiE
MNTLEEVRDEWEKLANRDAMGHIVTDPPGLGPEAFFELGRTEIAAVMDRVDPSGRKRALDFGCGVGRCTQALADYFDHVDGMDISPSMIEQAKALNRHGDKVRYLVWDRTELPYKTGTFDMVYTNIVLQHMRQQYAHEYIREFVRVVKKDTGRAVFEYPEGPDIPHPEPALSMFCTPYEQVVGIVEDAGGEVLDVQSPQMSGWACHTYTARRK